VVATAGWLPQQPSVMDTFTRVHAKYKSMHFAVSPTVHSFHIARIAEFLPFER
jgi:hypothetical protein